MTPQKAALIGARGFVGREMALLLDADPDFELVHATSRQHAGSAVRAVLGAGREGLLFGLSEPAVVAKVEADIFVLGLPNGFAAPYVEAISAVQPDALIIDLSSDYRHKEGWVYGLSDLCREDVRGARRIANPGCYATAALLALYPISSLIDGVPSVFGLSGYSGAGSSPNPRNDPKTLRSNAIPYAFPAHLHQAEIGEAIGHPVRFAPHVADFFRGLLCTVMVPLKPGVQIGTIKSIYKKTYADNQTVVVQPDPPTPRDAAGTQNAIIGGAAIDPQSNVLTVACAHDNLLKGAASQALANMRIARLSA